MGRAPTSGGITQARQRLGAEPMAELFSQVAGPVADLDTGGAFLGPWRLMSIDGMEWDVPDTAANRAAFGVTGPAASGGVPEGPGGYRQRVRLARAGAGGGGRGGRGKGSGEQSLARGLYPALEEDWLLIADRNFFNWDAWRAAAAPGRRCCGG